MGSIEFTDTPHQSHIPQQVHILEELYSQVAEEIAGLLNKGAIEEVQLGPESFISQPFLVKKKDGDSDQW